MDRSKTSSANNIDVLHEKTSSEIVSGNISKCQEFMRKFWKPRKQKCQTMEEGLLRTSLPPKTLLTGSTYDGTWEGPWMTGYGLYVFTNGVEYEGEFKDGMFHGQGDLRYPSGVKVKGWWNNGTLMERTIVFANNLHYSEKDWLYCKEPDRRYKIEYDDGVQPSGKSYMTADQPTRDVPKGMYDTGDGFFDSERFVHKGPDRTSILRAVSVKEKQWIMKHCRKFLDGSVGPVPELYGEWLPARVTVDPPPPPAAKPLSEPSLLQCIFVSDDEVDFMGRLLEIRGSSSSVTSSSDHNDDSLGTVASDPSISLEGPGIESREGQTLSEEHESLSRGRLISI